MNGIEIWVYLFTKVNMCIGFTKGIVGFLCFEPRNKMGFSVS